MPPIPKTPCPAGDVIAAFASGELPAGDVQGVQQHLSQCDACLEVVGHLASRSLASNSGPTASPASLATAGQFIGNYQLIRRVGEGGMGEVWAAQQTSPVRRLVALKLLKAGMDTRQVVARFEAERQMLALMQHPGIAQIFDAGITDAGRPYFAMEFVNGERITSWCDSASLALPDRLQLFQKVCDAVQHAHQKGVIHRDLKPSNVLVTLQDGRTQPKVIDFGLAKATTAELKDASLTELGTTLGTPAYASPEQMSLGAVDMDTRSDVYSLGVMLYELLVGVIPFEMDQASYAAMVELRRSIREQDPPRPSVRLGKLGARAEQIASERRTELPVLRRQLERELDWIVMKALEKDRDRRYASPKDLSTDIQRFLDNEPLVAGPPTTSYRLRKFVQRHRVGTALAAVFLGLITAFVAVTLVQSQRIARERDRAEAEAAKANSINAFLQEMLTAADPWQTGGDISIRDTLQRAAERTRKQFANEPLLAAEVMTTIGRAYVGLAQYDEAEPLIREALDLRKAQLGDQHPEVADSMLALSQLLQKRALHREAAEIGIQALKILRTTYGESHPTVANAADDLSRVLLSSGEYEAALQLAEEGLRIREQAFGANSVEVAMSLRNLGTILSEGTGRPEEAEQHLRRALDIYRDQFGSDDPRIALAGNELCSVLMLTQRYEPASQCFIEVDRITSKALGNVHPNTLVARENLANTLAYLGRFDESVPLLQEVLTARKDVLGENAPQVLRTQVNLAGHLGASNRVAEARTIFDDVVPRFAVAYGESHSEYGQVLVMYGKVLRKQQQDASAEDAFRRALAIQIPGVGQRHAIVATTEMNLGGLLLDHAQFPEAETLLLSAYETRKQIFGADAKATREVAQLLVQLYTKTGKPHQAARFEAPADPG